MRTTNPFSPLVLWYDNTWAADCGVQGAVEGTETSHLLGLLPISIFRSVMLSLGRGSADGEYLSLSAPSPAVYI